MDDLPPLPPGYRLPPAPWTIEMGPMEFPGDRHDFVVRDASADSIAWEHGIDGDVWFWRGMIRAVNATADARVLALAEHLNAMDAGQRDAALDEIREKIGGEW